MEEEEATLRRVIRTDLTDTLIRVGLIFILAMLALQVVAPFLHLILWALIAAIALYPLQQKIAAKLGGRQGRAATILVLGALLLLGTPIVMLSASFANHVHETITAVGNNTFELAPPADSVADWPVIGERVSAAWTAASEDLPGFLKDNEVQVKALSKKALGAATSTAGSVFLFLGALIVAGIMMAYGESGGRAMSNIFSRLVNPGRGPQLAELCTATVRSVTLGVIGVALIQAVLLGAGFIFAGVPAAGVLAMVVLFFGILQLPAALISLPVIAWLWVSGDGTTTMNTIWTVYLFIAGLSDNVLKPLLLGRGVEAPMPVILIGALGGMVAAGFIGLFVGAVLLAVGYQLFMNWVNQNDPDGEAKAATGIDGNNSSTGDSV